MLLSNTHIREALTQLPRYDSCYETSRNCQRSRSFALHKQCSSSNAVFNCSIGQGDHMSHWIQDVFTRARKGDAFCALFGGCVPWMLIEFYWDSNYLTSDRDWSDAIPYVSPLQLCIHPLRMRNLSIARWTQTRIRSQLFSWGWLGPRGSVGHFPTMPVSLRPTFQETLNWRDFVQPAGVLLGVSPRKGACMKLNSHRAVLIACCLFWLAYCSLGKMDVTRSFQNFWAFIPNYTTQLHKRPYWERFWADSNCLGSHSTDAWIKSCQRPSRHVILPCNRPQLLSSSIISNAVLLNHATIQRWTNITRQ
jgi:hypothetical protein